MTMRRAPHEPRGFTLIEVMVVVGLVGVLVALAAPNLFRMLRRGDLRSEARLLYAAFVEAQGLAINSGNRGGLRLVLSGDDRGWEVLVDRNGDGTLERDRRHRFADSRPGIGFGPATGFPQAFAAPYAAVPHDAWCTPCGAGNTEGTITFDADGLVVGGVSGSIVLQNTAGELPNHVEALVFIGATGAVRLDRVE